MKDTRRIFILLTCAIMQRTYLRVPRDFVRTRVRCNYAIPASYAWRAADSNPVYRSPFAVAFPTYFHFLTFPTGRRDAKHGEATPARKRQNRKAPREDETRELRDHEKSRNIATPFITGPGKRGRESSVSRKMLRHKFSLFPS